MQTISVIDIIVSNVNITVSVNMTRGIVSFLNQHGWYDRTEVQELIVRSLPTGSSKRLSSMGINSIHGNRDISGKTLVCLSNSRLSGAGEDNLADPVAHLGQMLSKNMGQHDCNTIVLPLIIKDNHFVVLVYDPPQRAGEKACFVYVDSFGTPPPAFVNEAIHKHYPDAELLFSAFHQQVNGRDCGPLCVQNACDLVMTGKLSITSPKLADDLRAKHEPLLAHKGDNTGFDLSAVPVGTRPRTTFTKVVESPTSPPAASESNVSHSSRTSLRELLDRSQFTQCDMDGGQDPQTKTTFRPVPPRRRL